ncbi:hypothetical protein [Nocardia sp. NPDC050406]|uniref:hypothetical protein n=1 Tax=Nocardia sp. NPDC050406 TaxID=3364318 RepID=UPI003794CF81
MRISLFAAALLALPLLAACGSSEDSKPPVTEADLAKSLQTTLQDPAVADCAAKIYVAEGISQDGLRVMIDKEVTTNQALDPEQSGMSKEDQDKAVTATNRIVTECLK